MDFQPTNRLLWVASGEFAGTKVTEAGLYLLSEKFRCYWRWYDTHNVPQQVRWKVAAVTEHEEYELTLPLQGAELQCTTMQTFAHALHKQIECCQV